VCPRTVTAQVIWTTKLDVKNPIAVPPSTLSQPIPVDVDGDMKIDLLGITPSSKSNSKSPLQIWQNVWNVTRPESPLFEMCAIHYWYHAFFLTSSQNNPRFPRDTMYIVGPSQQCGSWSQWRLSCWYNIRCFSCVPRTYTKPSDLFLVCDNSRGGKSYQIWVNNKVKGFSLSQEGPLPSGVQSISFADIGTVPCKPPFIALLML
jgi:integrin alpha FG-GAP repeat containing protein 1